MTKRHWPIVLLVLFGFVFCRTLQAADESCTGAPKYHVAKGAHASSGSQKMTLYLQIDVVPDAISTESLLQLACRLSKDFAREQRLKVWIFTDSQAAKRFNFDQRAPTYQEDLARLRGAYWLDREKSEQWIRFSSDPQKPEDMHQVDLPAPKSD